MNHYPLGWENKISGAQGTRCLNVALHKTAGLYAGQLCLLHRGRNKPGEADSPKDTTSRRRTGSAFWFNPHTQAPFIHHTSGSQPSPVPVLTHLRALPGPRWGFCVEHDMVVLRAEGWELVSPGCQPP